MGLDRGNAPHPQGRGQNRNVNRFFILTRIRTGIATDRESVYTLHMKQIGKDLNRVLRWMPMFLFVLFATYMLSQAHGYNPDTGSFGNDCARYGWCDNGTTEVIND
jgi:hypothetical protein